MLQPVFIIGVPRSGTTLLRVLLDSHSKIAGAPETTWIAGGYGPELSFRGILNYLTDHKLGAVKNLSGVKSETITELAREFLSGILSEYLTDKKKEVLVLKTPDDVKHLDFLLGLFPDSKFIHIYRDVRDVACSTMKHKELLFDDDLKEYGKISFYTAAYRWYEWEQKIRNFFSGDLSGNYFCLSYENLVNSPEKELTKVCGFIGVEFEPDMTDYSKKQHDYPDWELGSIDVKRRLKIDPSSIGKWKKKLPMDETLKIEKTFGTFLTDLGYRLSSNNKTKTEMDIQDDLQTITGTTDRGNRVDQLHKNIINLKERITEKRVNIKQKKLKLIERKSDLENIVMKISELIGEKEILIEEKEILIRDKEEIKKIINDLKMDND